MPTLQELLGDFGVGESEKTASEAGNDEIEALAAHYGFDFGKQAEEDKKDKKEDHEDSESDDEEAKEEKKASVGLDDYFHSLFPEDAPLSKTAEEMEKAAYEENLGARAYDHFATRFDRRIDKIASELTGAATISAPTGADHEGNVHQDPTIAQANKTNRPANASEKIDTTPTITDEISAKNEAKTVGHFEQKHAAMQSMAMRKAFLLSQLEG